MTTDTANPRKTNLADLAVVLGLAGLIVWYFIDARNASTEWLNLVLILPVTAVALVLCAVQLVRSALFAARETAGARHRARQTPIGGVLPAMLLFAGYVASLNWLGFDVGTALFVALFLWVHGERRLTWVLGYSVCLASLLSVFFASMLPYPLPMLVSPS